MNESKVVRYEPDSSAYGYFLGMRKAEYGDYVTHTDYKALEERHAFITGRLEHAVKHAVELREELASLKARVGELVEADKEMSDVSGYGQKYIETCKRYNSALEALK